MLTSSRPPALRFLPPFILGVAALAGLILAWSPAGEWADRALAPAQFAAARRPASGRIVVVEMDAASVAAIHHWPWPRGNYADVLDRLRRAGAASVTFDVDLSSASTPAGDAALAGALARADGLVALPTFAQDAGSNDARSIDTLPLPAFRRHVALASVSVAPDDDGMVRRAPYGTLTAGTPRPSLAAYMAHRSGEADRSFPIAFGIDPATVPRLSFVAVRDGRFDAAAVRGRDVLIGATAIEMGDRYATPLWGVIPGVIVQALAGETLLAGLPREASPLPLLLLALFVGAAVLRIRRLDAALALAAVAIPLLFAGTVLAQARWLLWLPLAPALAVVGAVAFGRVVLHLAGRFAEQRATDEVTGLPNRRAMIQTLAAEPAVVAVVLLANLEPLLAVLGEAAERDLILRLVERLRVATGSAATYRIADRLLAVAVPDRTTGDAARARLRALLLQPIEVAGRRVDPAVHVGVSDAPSALADRLTDATRAAEAAAAAGEFWRQASRDRDALEIQVSLMGELDQAIRSGEIEVHYQPKLALADDRITAVEALVRWRHPTRGMIRPDLFIPLAEQADRIAPLTCFVLEQVVRDLAEWRAAGLALNVAVNVSAKLVADEAFGATLRDVLSSGRVDPADLTLEVTESATLADPDRAAAALQSYRALGCGVSMDDYGTGQSTLSYLQRLPLSELKIDRSFVQHAHVNEADGLMVSSTVELAHRLGLKVVAEGIEDAECLAFLRTVGCDMAQGYFVSRPLPKTELRKLLAPASLAA